MNKIIIWTLVLLMAATPLQNCNAFFTRTYAKASTFFKGAVHFFKTNRFVRHFSAPTQSYPPKNIAKQSVSRDIDDWDKYTCQDDNHMPCPRWVKISAIFGLLYSFDEVSRRYAASRNKSKQS